MAGEPEITIVGNATADGELRFLPSGVAVCNFTVAQTPRTKKGEVWEDGTTMFFRVAVWRDMAEHVAESVKRGTRVIVKGRFTTGSYTTSEGVERTTLEVQADEVGIALRYGTATFNKAERTSTPPAADPWATPPTAGGWGTPPAAAPPGWGAPPAAPPTAPPAAPSGPPAGWGPAGYPEPPY